MYEELVKRLKACVANGKCGCCPMNDGNCPGELQIVNEAADAIEKLSKRIDRAVKRYNRGFEKSAMYEALVGIAPEPSKEEE